jgi:hypothetical protein
MAYKDALIAELKYESDLTKRMLERVPVKMVHGDHTKNR